MKKGLIIATAAVFFVCSVLCAIVSDSRNCSDCLLKANIEALTDSESAPGESENCTYTGNINDHCIYHYNGVNYNIEESINK